MSGWIAGNFVLMISPPSYALVVTACAAFFAATSTFASTVEVDFVGEAPLTQVANGHNLSENSPNSYSPYSDTVGTNLQLVRDSLSPNGSTALAVFRAGGEVGLVSRVMNGNYDAGFMTDGPTCRHATSFARESNS
jgi:hypothetical protein